MYQFKYHKIEHREEFKVDRHDQETKNYYVYYFYFIKEFYRQDDNLERLFDFTIEWSKTNTLALEDVDYRAIVDHCEYTHIKRLLEEQQYDEVFEELNKLENVKITRYDRP